MLVKVFALGMFALGGIMLADVLTHPQGVKAAGTQIVNLEKNTGNQLLGKTA
jgi:hypothetical protein